MAVNDPRPTAIIVAEALAQSRSPDELGDAYWHNVGTLHGRGGQTEFDTAIKLLRSEDASERELGVDVLGQLGWGHPTFVAESVAPLIADLRDTSADVVSSAAHSLGHRRSPDAIPHLLALIGHPNENVRFGVTQGLSCHNDRRATDGLIHLCHDKAEHVRDWASFGLAEMCSLDYPELRAELHRQLLDENPEIRGQAFRGLAERGDRSCLDALRNELSGEFHGTWAFEAAGVFADPSLLDALALCRKSIGRDEPDYFYTNLDEAVEACRTQTSTRNKGRT